MPESYHPTPALADTQWNDIATGEALSDSSQCEIKEFNKTPHYTPELDYIGIPSKSSFDTSGNYYSTLAHEMAHSTGHKSRLDRVGVSGSERTKLIYSFEELIAELSAVFTTKHLGIDGNLENHASYINSWLAAMRNDKKFIFKAASQAQKATEFILKRMAKQDELKAA